MNLTTIRLVLLNKQLLILIVSSSLMLHDNDIKQNEGHVTYSVPVNYSIKCASWFPWDTLITAFYIIMCSVSSLC